jgi:hypothetical protein
MKNGEGAHQTDKRSYVTNAVLEERMKGIDHNVEYLVSRFDKHLDRTEANNVEMAKCMSGMKKDIEHIDQRTARFSVGTTIGSTLAVIITAVLAFFKFER